MVFGLIEDLFFGVCVQNRLQHRCCICLCSYTLSEVQHNRDTIKCKVDILRCLSDQVGNFFWEGIDSIEIHTCKGMSVTIIVVVIPAGSNTDGVGLRIKLLLGKDTIGIGEGVSACSLLRLTQCADHRNHLLHSKINICHGTIHHRAAAHIQGSRHVGNAIPAAGDGATVYGSGAHVLDTVGNTIAVRNSVDLCFIYCNGAAAYINAISITILGKSMDLYAILGCNGGTACIYAISIAGVRNSLDLCRILCRNRGTACINAIGNILV